MSDPNTHAAGQTPVPQSNEQSQAPSYTPDGAREASRQSPRPTARPASSSANQQRKLSTFLKVSIILLAGLTIASISLLFIGDFEGKFERVFSTFALFAVFVIFTALDTRREQKSEWYAPVALIANAYILGLLMIVIWMTPYNPYSLLWEIFWKSFFVILVTRLVILCAELLLRVGAERSETITRFAFVTSVLAVLSGILFTAPVGIEAFELNVPDMYWKIATAILILTALGLSITLLLRWFFGADEREAARAARGVRGGARPGSPAPYVAQQSHGRAQQLQHQAQQQQAQQQRAQLQHQTQPQQPQQPQQQAQSQSQPTAPQPQPSGQPELLPWPTFADGRPIPAGHDGQPDFSVPGAPRPPQGR
ncbi:hypothetical protein [Leucobacter sp. NPDC077196]|uniref:hypothetical protein n=1 Tax=Leucobacter sp. NPDC077196 TaxID=3154959 RepID=UPI0034462773